MLKTAECVTPKHPDKMCDQISDAIVDLYLGGDPDARVAVEVMGGHGKVFILGEVTSSLDFTIGVFEALVHGITGHNETVVVNLAKQSPDIARGVDTGGAGDQGIMVGYACDENKAMIPQEIYLARSLCKWLYEGWRVDGKTQVTIENGGSGKVMAIVASFQLVSSQQLKTAITDWADNVGVLLAGAEVFCNPAGDWEIGGFDADTGLTGRKLAVDSYGPQIPIGGGAFSGKDPSKVDRSGAYMARKIAVDLLREHGAKEVMVKIAYAIGQAEPVMAWGLITDHDGKEIVQLLSNSSDPVGRAAGLTPAYDLTPNGIMEYLQLNRPIYQQTAKWGHFGNGFEWDTPEVPHG